MNYDKEYYAANAQDKDRPALWMYERIWKRYLGSGPVLDFGCGVGHFARRLSEHESVYGLETNSFALTQLPENAPKVRLLATTSELPARSLGSITALHVLEHIDEESLAAIGTEFDRILRPGGRVLAVMPDLDGRAHFLKKAHWSAFSDSTHINLKGADDWKLFFERQWKFNVMKCFADGYYDFPYGVSRMQSILGDTARIGRTLTQFLAGRPLLSQGDGENAIFILEKQG